VAIKDLIHHSPASHWQRSPALIDLAGIRVLLVDDDVEQLELVSSLLADANAEVVTATSADDGVQQLARHSPDVIVSDINMPGCDGYHFLRMVRARASRGGGATPAIALTGKVTTEDQTRAFLAGYQVHLAKPFRLIELLVAIRNVVERHSAL
jgi:CheY-like chemotaxis protein